ncbi:MAG: META domain-containing protein [Myxococcota bacterium]
MSPSRLLFVALPALSLACATVGGGNGNSASLEDRTFLSQSVTENGADRPLEGGVANLSLRFQEGSGVSGSAGCNSLSGSYSINDGVFVMTDAAQTEIGCEPALLAQDEWYFGFLGSSPAITIQEQGVVLEGGGIRIEYLDQEVATPDLALAGQTWTVDTLIDGEVASNAAWPEPATIVFGDDGTVQVNTGCNSGSGTYSVSGNELTFVDVGVTEAGCVDELAQELERVVLGLVYGAQPVTWEVTASRLTLQGEQYGLGLVGG